MKRVFLFLVMVLFMIPTVMSQTKITQKKHKKDGYKEYEMEMEMGGNIKTSSVISTLDLQFSYDKYFSGYNNKGRMFFKQRGYESCAEKLDNGKNEIGLILVLDGKDTLKFRSTYISVNYWTVNGQMAERPDRFMNYSFYDIYDADIDKIIKSETVDIIKFGAYEGENAGWYFSEANLYDLKFFMNLVRNDNPEK